jgi:hypothetical protein
LYRFLAIAVLLAPAEENKHREAERQRVAKVKAAGQQGEGSSENVF